MLRVKEGDYRAFDLLYARYRGPVLRFLFALTWDAQAAEDGLQEVFVGLFQIPRELCSDRETLHLSLSDRP